jgi:hypothetical protein
MNTHSTLSSVAALIDSNTAATQPSTLPPATVPPGPVSGVFVIGRPATNRPPGLPCAEHWPGADTTATLRPSQVMSVAVDEIDWLYEHTDDETDPECIRARATIESWLGELSFEHQLVIAQHHDPTPWPEELRGSRRGESPRTPGHEEDSARPPVALPLESSGSQVPVHPAAARAPCTPAPRALDRVQRSARDRSRDPPRPLAIRRSGARVR